MAESLAKIVRSCFTDKYEPKEALQVLFLNTYQPEQDHNPDFLLALTDASSIFRKRIIYYFDALKEKAIVDDESLVNLFDRILRKGGYTDFDDVLRKYEGYARKGICKSNDWRNDLYHNFVPINPTNLTALWAIKHECETTDEEYNFLVE